MRHTDYKAIFQKRCSQHKELNADKYAFSTMFVSRNPMQQEIDLAEFWSSIRDNEGMQVVLQNYDADYEGADFDTKHRYLHGALLVLDSVDKKDDWQRRDEVMDKTERIAEELMAAVAHDINQTYKHLLTPSDLLTEAIANVSTFHGTRISFRIKQLAVPDLNYNPTLFE